MMAGKCLDRIQARNVPGAALCLLTLRTNLPSSSPRRPGSSALRSTRWLFPLDFGTGSVNTEQRLHWGCGRSVRDLLFTAVFMP